MDRTLPEGIWNNQENTEQGSSPYLPRLQQLEIHTDGSNVQLGCVISQQGHPIAFYLQKLNPTQTSYTITKRELLAIVETLKEYRNILLGHPIKVYTAHLNLCYKTNNTSRVMHWHLLIKEYGPELCHIPGACNVVADALGCLDLHPLSPSNNLKELLTLEDKLALPPSTFPYSMPPWLRLNPWIQPSWRN